MQPNFLIIGAPRTGTTHIYKGLRQHPQVYMSDFKEPMFFAYEGENVPGMTNTWDEYVHLFDNAQSGQIIGEASTLYLWKESTPANIHRYLPDVKLIAVLRNPIERAFSQYTFQRLLGVEPYATFEEALEAEPTRARDRSSSDFFRYTEVGLYAHQVARYQEQFSKDHLMIFLNEDLESDQQQVFQTIFTFIEVDSSFSPNLAHRANASGIPQKKLWYETIKAGGRLIKGFLPEVWTTRLSGALNERYLARPKISPDTYRRLLKFYEDDIKHTEDLIGRDLSAWRVIPEKGVER